jgi:SHS2 domain-containing protein
MTSSFEYLDISGDAGIRAFGKTREELFANAALGLYSLITDLSVVEEKRDLSVSASGAGLEGLLVAWLNELIFHFDTNGFIGRRIVISTLEDQSLSAVVSGEDFDPGRHARGLLVKAATYHRLTVAERRGVWTAEVIFDI